MKPEDLPEEHRKYLEMSDNPKRITNTSIFAMLSDGLTELKVSLGKMETKQEQFHGDLSKIDVKLDKVDTKLVDKIETLEDDFLKCRTSGLGRRGEMDERFRWQERTSKVIITLIVFIIGLILTLHFGIGFPIP